MTEFFRAHKVSHIRRLATLAWFMVAAASCGDRHGTAAETDDGFRLDDEYRKIRRIEVKADCRGPGGRYTTEIHSFEDGYFYFHQKYVGMPGEFKGVMLDSIGYSLGLQNEILAKLNRGSRAIIRSHDFHRMVLLPDAYAHDRRLIRRSKLNGRHVVLYAATDGNGLPVTLFYDPSMKVVRGVRMHNPVDTGAIVLVVMDEWRPTDFGRVPYHAMVIQSGRDTFQFDYNQVEFNNMDTEKVLMADH